MTLLSAVWESPRKQPGNRWGMGGCEDTVALGCSHTCSARLIAPLLASPAPPAFGKLTWLRLSCPPRSEWRPGGCFGELGGAPRSREKVPRCSRLLCDPRPVAWRQGGERVPQSPRPRLACTTPRAASPSSLRRQAPHVQGAAPQFSDMSSGCSPGTRAVVFCPRLPTRSGPVALLWLFVLRTCHL